MAQQSRTEHSCEDCARYGDLREYPDQRPPIQKTSVHAIIEAQVKKELEALFDSKLKIAIALTKGGVRGNQGDSWFNK